MNTLPSDWDIIQKSLHSSILQSSVWAKFQTQLNRGVYFDRSNHWSWLGFERQSKGIRYLLLPYGPTIRQNAKEALDSVVQKATSAGFDFVRLEPIGQLEIDQLSGIGAHQIAEVEPEHTQIIDLTKPEEELRKELQSGHRNRINTAQKRGIEVVQHKDLSPLDDFLVLMHDTARHAGIKNYDDSYYRTMAETMVQAGAASFYVAKAEGELASISLIYDWNDTRYYAHTGNNQAVNRQSKAAVVNVWTMMIDAKNLGLSSFDMWGVAPEGADSKHKWAGISEFKRGFGGQTVNTLGTWDIPLKKGKYKAYNMYRKLRGRG